MKVFLSWSGSLSHKVAHELGDWLPYVIQAIEPFVSSEHIDKGERWSEDLMAHLKETAYGIICLTRHNMSAAWMNFEAGALAKAIHRSYVAPFLFEVERADVVGPLEQFQFTLYRQAEVAASKEEVFKLVSSINSKLGPPQQVPQERLHRQFDTWWPELHKRFETINTTPEVGYLAGLPWLYLPQDLLVIQASVDCKVIWVMTPELLHTLDPKNEHMTTNLARGVTYHYLIPDSSENHAGQEELRRVAAARSAQLRIRVLPQADFDNLAVSNYLIVNPDCEAAAFPLRMFLELPVNQKDPYWIEVEYAAAVKFVSRFRPLMAPP